jgi:hypothetical protein
VRYSPPVLRKGTVGVLLAVALAACGGSGSGDDGGLACGPLVAAWEAAKVATQATRVQAQSPVGPGGSSITAEETNDIVEASAQQARARDAAVAAGCL